MFPHRSSQTRRHVIKVIALLAMLVTNGTARAAGDDNSAVNRSTSASRQVRPPSDPDFLFGRPRSMVGVAGGWLFASQAGNVFDFTYDQLTVNKSDFDTSTIRFDVGRSLSPRLDVVVELGFSRASVASEYRDFVEFDGLPITQTTMLSQLPIGGSLRFWLTPRGREVGRLTWIPNRIAPYIGTGGGWRWYRFTQFGDFVDFVDSSIFSAELESGGWTLNGHIFAGASISLTRQLFLGVEVRYARAGTRLSRDFVGFDNITLGGFQTTGGIEFVF